MDFEIFLKDISSLSHGVLAPHIPLEKYIPLDLSSKNKQLIRSKVYDTAEKFELYIQKYLEDQNGLVAYGGYCEVRELYQNNALFSTTSKEEVRNIHLGVDFWCPAQTPIFTPLDGVVHSFQNNATKGNYGPTLILEHAIRKKTFYTLYGHLSSDSISTLHKGKKFEAGEQLGTLGTAAINGGYAPHLHFQIIENMENYQGDYPGVSSKKNLDSFIKNCPDPLLLLHF